MKKRLIAVVTGVTVLSLSACSSPADYKLNFDGKRYTSEQLEDKLEAQLAKENANKEYDVDIASDDDHVKKKKKKKAKVTSSSSSSSSSKTYKISRVSKAKSTFKTSRVSSSRRR